MATSITKFICKTCSKCGSVKDSIICVNCQMRNHVTCCTSIAQCSRLTDRFECNNCYSIERSSRSTQKSSNFGSSYHSTLTDDDTSIKGLNEIEYQDMLFNKCEYHGTDSLNNILRNRTNELLIIHFNIRSLEKNIDKMSQYLSELKRQPDVIALTETKLKDNICGNIKLAGYKFIHVNSPTLAGGVGFYVNEKLKYSVLGKLEMKVNFVENMWIKIETNKKLLVLGVVYRHPVRAVEHISLFTSELSNLFHSLNLQKLEFCVAGNFSIDLLQLEKKSPCENVCR